MTLSNLGDDPLSKPPRAWTGCAVEGPCAHGVQKHTSDCIPAGTSLTMSNPAERTARGLLTPNVVTASGFNPENACSHIGADN